MAKKETTNKTNKTKKAAEIPDAIDMGCCSCRVESLVSVDERGQMVIPKAVRDKAGIVAGEKVMLATYEMGGKVRFIALIKADEMAAMAKNMLDFMLKETR